MGDQVAALSRCEMGQAGILMLAAATFFSGRDAIAARAGVPLN